MSSTPLSQLLKEFPLQLIYSISVQYTHMHRHQAGAQHRSLSKPQCDAPLSSIPHFATRSSQGPLRQQHHAIQRCLYGADVQAPSTALYDKSVNMQHLGQPFQTLTMKPCQAHSRPRITWRMEPTPASLLPAACFHGEGIEGYPAPSHQAVSAFTSSLPAQPSRERVPHIKPVPPAARGAEDGDGHPLKCCWERGLPRCPQCLMRRRHHPPSPPAAERRARHWHQAAGPRLGTAPPAACHEGAGIVGS